MVKRHTLFDGSWQAKRNGIFGLFYLASRTLWPQKSTSVNTTNGLLTQKSRQFVSPDGIVSPKLEKGSKLLHVVFYMVV
ncbi:hypothetical protein PFISCL1PPCAC_18290, partial [Pristionchus fissidentatus]